ncbi:3-oxoacid CoA-transferase subunit A [Acinetobacter gerneri]|jgi:3-oxoadipate CoA-transferase alpha subunit|uniref:3-oxoacid CoA-transferase subunit A n=1 Tax=Acinetobacter gerneri TaxID=202952 RepID=UPI0023F1994A|nr:3-oxoacid CoA-transferase subunit A [Acinetobacter gerneri]MCH4243404.1 3-oxoacid CoA-transferase subunit A [Acinetobacter gerneri]
MNKISHSIYAALANIQDGARIMLSGFGTAGQPAELIEALLECNLKELEIISNNAGNGDFGLAKLIKEGAVRKIICSFPRAADAYVFDEMYRAGKIELELVPQGNLACRMQAAGMGLGPIYTPTGFGTLLAENKPTMHYQGKDFVLEEPLHADFALIKAEKADRWGNLIYRKAARNFAPIMAMAADCTIAQVNQIVELGELDPEHIITPGIFVQHVVQVAQTAQQRANPSDAKGSEQTSSGQISVGEK